MQIFVDEKLPELKAQEAALKKLDKDDAGHDAMEAFVGLLKKVEKKDTEAYNKALKDLITKTAAWQKAAVALDGQVAKAGEAMKKDAKDETKDAVKKALTPVEHRQTLSKVTSALDNLSEVAKKASSSKANEDGDGDDKDGKDGKDDDDKDKKEAGGSAAGAIIGAVVGVLVVAGGVFYCYRTKKLCFKSEEEGGAANNEGGQTDRKLYKKEVKSSNAHKRHAKEALMPAFKVADEQA